MPYLLAIDTSSAWCSVALSLENQPPKLRHELVSSGASQILLPWIEDLLIGSNQTLSSLDAIAVDIGPGAFTGVRLGIAVVQGLATAANLPVLPVPSVDAIAAQAVKSEAFATINPHHFVIAIDARMDEIYWAKYRSNGCNRLPDRIGNILLTRPEDIDLADSQFLAGSAINAYRNRLFIKHSLPHNALHSEIGVSALGVLDCATQMLKLHQEIPIANLEPLYIRNKVALTTEERESVSSKGN